LNFLQSIWVKAKNHMNIVEVNLMCTVLKGWAWQGARPTGS